MSNNGFKGFTPHNGSWTDKIWLNRYLVGTGIVDIASGAIQGGIGLAEDLWNEDPNAFQNAAGRASTILGGGATVVTTSLWAGFHKLSFGKNTYGDVYRHEDGSIYGMSRGKDKTRILKHIEGGSSRGAEIAGSEVNTFIKGSQKGFYRASGIGKGFFKTGFWRGPGGMLAMIGVPMAVEAIARPTLGFVGRLLDEGNYEYHRAKSPYYDNRYFNTQQWQQNSYQQLGAAMNGYENNQMSIARIHHQR